ncbi:hypothetical protein [Isoptericola sp. NPDC057391]|uniref:hypothetical protein n=1 Tax=Isoptericola sp. NPDC057391 TaxID=3346117 RepID=UPI00363714E7
MTTTQVRRIARQTPLAFFPDVEPANEAMLLAHSNREEVLEEHEREAPYMTVILSHSASDYSESDVWMITDPEHINFVQAAIVGE